MTSNQTQSENSASRLPGMREINQILAPYMRASWSRAIWQLVNSVGSYLLLIALMFYSLRWPYWVTLLLAIPAAGFLVRVFIIFHDCGHNSFTPSLRANKVIGFITGVMVLTPSEQWWKSHAIHHASSGNLDKRGVGDVDTWTVEEFRSRKPLARLGYLLFRNPLVMFLLGPVYMFFIAHRFTLPPHGKRETWSVVWANLAILAWLMLAVFLAGSVLDVIKVFLPAIWLGGMMGVWMFYVQHQYEGVYWARDKEWDYVRSALKGASYYQLPRVMQFFSGNIGFHHIHHLNPRVPNYYLEPAHRSDPLFAREARTVGFLESLSTPRLMLIDEERANQLITYGQAGD